MKLIACQSADDVAAKALDELKRIAESRTGPLNIMVPTGSTPKPLYALFRNDAGFWTKKVRPVQIDEFADRKRLFASELEKLFISPLGLGTVARMIDPTWDEARMVAHVESVLSQGLDIVILGLGPNGHVGFHEPGYSREFTGGRVTISAETKNRVAGASTDQALTFGVGAFLQAREILLLVTGSGKAAMLKKILQEDVGTTVIPAAFLKAHPRLTVITDQNI